MVMICYHGDGYIMLFNLCEEVAACPANFNKERVTELAFSRESREIRGVWKRSLRVCVCGGGEKRVGCYIRHSQSVSRDYPSITVAT